MTPLFIRPIFVALFVFSSIFTTLKAETPNSDEHVKELSWLVGDFNLEKDGESIHITGKMEDQFLIVFFTVKDKSEKELQSYEFIGWNPYENELQSWLVDSDGGNGDAIWKKEGDRWIVTRTYQFSDGKRGSATATFTVGDDGKITYESTGREIDGMMLPSIGPITFEKGQR